MSDNFQPCVWKYLTIRQSRPLLILPDKTFINSNRFIIYRFYLCSIKTIKGMNLVNFIFQYPDKASCRAKFKEYRDREGVVCPHCDSQAHYWKSDKECYECKQCKYRKSLRANTIMHASNLPFRYWFIAIHLLTSTKKSFSAAELQRQLDYKRYEPIWAMLHKLRSVMGMRDG
jgi:Zn ribbon nucleic-acid-binding protein